MVMETVPSRVIKPRYRLLDELRGFMVFCMVFYHGFYTLSSVFGLNVGTILFDFFSPAEPFFAGGFILLSGCMCNFSRSNLKRGGLLLGISLVLTTVTVLLSPYVGDVQIYFGILHLLAVSMILAGLLKGVLARINPLAGLLVCLFVFILTFGIPANNTDFLGVSRFVPEGLTEIGWLFPIGISKKSFQSADYFPLLPWMFLFFAGYFVGRLGVIQKYDRIFMPSRFRPFAFLGRHALVIYVLHQPVIFGVVWLLNLALL